MPVTQRGLSSTTRTSSVDLFAVVREGDVLVHHPYDSFATSVEEFIRQARCDPQVLAIKTDPLPDVGRQPDRRVADPGGRGGQAGRGPRRAEGPVRRGTEHRVGPPPRGGRRARGLRAVGLKTHSKTCLVVRAGGRRHPPLLPHRYRQLQLETAHLYEDLGLITADPEIGADLSELFNYLTGYARNVSYKRLLVAPHSLRHL